VHGLITFSHNFGQPPQGWYTSFSPHSSKKYLNQKSFFLLIKSEIILLAAIALNEMIRDKNSKILFILSCLLDDSFL
jgi:hypothetical protein